MWLPATSAAADSCYGNPPFIYPLAAQRGIHGLVRVRHDRLFFRPPLEAEGPAREHPRWYGERFVLSDPATWPPPDDEQKS